MDNQQQQQQTKHHTPGPWIKLYDPEIHAYQICTDNQGYVVATVETEETANLIVAAPELLSALQSSLRFACGVKGCAYACLGTRAHNLLLQPEDLCVLHHKVHKAIAKATGGSTEGRA